MDTGTVTQLIGSLGFPIVACVALFIQNNKQEEMHKEEMDKVTVALNNNTTVLTRLETALSSISHKEA